MVIIFLVYIENYFWSHETQRADRHFSLVYWIRHSFTSILPENKYWFNLRSILLVIQISLNNWYRENETTGIKIPAYLGRKTQSAL